MSEADSRVRHFALAIALVATAASAQQKPPPPDPCAAAESRQFDFWIGDWDVLDKSGKRVGTNRIAAIYGCVLHESWKAGAFEGQSFNRHDRARGVWHQTWVDSGGNLLLLEGGLRDGAMVMSDRGLPGKRDAARINEIAWTPGPDGTVRQHWRASGDGGKTWKDVFDGRYVRSSRSQPRGP